MSILYREDSRQFHLTNGKISYIFCVVMTISALATNLPKMLSSFGL